MTDLFFSFQILKYPILKYPCPLERGAKGSMPGRHPDARIA